ncbi:MAG: hypothetical protein Q7S00_03775, partial [bacterium]|nr:hypothetical protein [bacterium]
QYTVLREKLPPPMKENLLLIDNPSQPLTGTNYLHINLQPAPKELTGAADTLISVTYILPPNALEKSIAEFEAIHEEIRQKIIRLAPFAEESLKQVFPIASAEETLFPENSDSYEKFRQQGREQVWYTPSFFFPTLTTPYENMFLAGPHLLSWLGMEGRILTALKAVDLIWKQEFKARNP